MTSAAFPPQLAARGGSARLLRERRNRESLHLHAADRVGAFFLGLFLQRFLLRGEEYGRICPVGFFEVARPQIARLVEMQVAVHDEIALACHDVLRSVMRRL